MSKKATLIANGGEHMGYGIKLHVWGTMHVSRARK